MSQRISKRFVILAALFAFIFSTFAQYFSLPANAVLAWRALTDTEFAETGSQVSDMAIYEDKLYFNKIGSEGEELVYQYDKATDEVTIVNQEMVTNDGVVAIKQLEAVNGRLYVLAHANGQDVIYYYFGGSWFPLISYPGGYDGEIFYLGSVNNQLVAQVRVLNGENTYRYISLYNTDTSTWMDVARENSFSGMDSAITSLQSVVFFESSIYAAVYDYNLGDTAVYRYQNSRYDWEQIGSNFDGPYTNLLAFNNQLFITSDDWNQELQLLSYDSDVSDWTTVEADFGDEYMTFAKATQFDNKLYLGVSHYMGSDAVIYESEDGFNWQIFEDAINGGIPFPEGENMSGINSMTSYDNALVVGASRSGEGSYYPIVWMRAEVELPVEDTDPVSAEIENAAPNNGDANNDGTPDSEQDNVVSFVNEITGSYSVLEHTCASTDEVLIKSESTNSSADNAFNYPVGLMHFVIECSTGQTATITQYHYGNYDSALMVARKFNSVTGQYSTITEAQLSNITIAGNAVLKVVHEVTDGGDLDEDGVANGIIVDPVGPALNSVGIPNTGFGGLSKL